MGDNKVIKPFHFQSSGRWIGNDGNWSAFFVSLGTPPQLWHALPSFYAQTLYLPIDVDCARLSVSDCAYSRGAEALSREPYQGFQRNKSSTWEDTGFYRADIGRNFGLTGNGLFGRDRIELSQNETGKMPTINDQIVAAFATPDLWTGLLGLCSRPLKFLGINQLQSQPLLGKLHSEGVIPSLSFGYQAGAYYRSLVLGGYDQSRISEKAIEFSFADDLFIGLQKMTMSSRDGNVTLLNDGILMMFDTAAAEIWLPPGVCDFIASTLGLTYIVAADRYVVNASTRATLQNLSPTFSFTVGKYKWGGQNVVIDIPYAAFDLQASYPIFNSTTNYFPLRRGNESQYTFGRAFLQEVYLTVDWERSVLSVGQAVFRSPMPAADIVTIKPTTYEKVQTSSHLSAGAIAGAVVGVVILFIIFVLLAWYIIRRRRNRTKSEPTAIVAASIEEKNDSDLAEMADTRADRELHGYHIEEMHASHGQNEVHSVQRPFGGQHAASEISSSQVHELPHSGQGI